MNKSESITKIAAAYTKAQPLIEGAIKDKTNPAFRSKYADLGSVVDAIKPPLAQFGLAFVQCPHDADHAARVETILLHESGEWMSLGEVTVPVTKIDAHGFGSALTYARRYGLLAAFGVAPEDDDGNAAAKNPPKLEAKPAPKEEDLIFPPTKEEAFNLLPKKEQDFLREVAANITSLVSEGRTADAHGYYVTKNLDVEEKLGLWFLLGSKERAALKKEEANADLQRRAAERNKHQQSRPSAQVPQ